MSQPATSLHTTDMHGLLDRWQAGDRDAANVLVLRAGQRLRRLARRMYRGFPNIQSIADTADVLQDSWLRLLRTLHKIRPARTRDFFNLAAVHIRRELIDLARKVECRGGCHASLQDLAGAESASGVPVPEPEHRSPADYELWVRFHEAVEELDPRSKEVVGLAFYHGCTQEEMAQIFEADVRSVRRWWKDACYELRARVGHELLDMRPHD